MLRTAQSRSPVRLSLSRGGSPLALVGSDRLLVTRLLWEDFSIPTRVSYRVSRHLP